MSQKPSLGIFIPTIGGRPNYLPLAVSSIKRAMPKDREVVFFVLIESMFFDAIETEKLDCEVRTIDGHQRTIAEKVAAGIAMIADLDYATWLGDDDLLDSEALVKACETLDTNPRSSFVYGKCVYVDSSGKEIGSSSFGNLATKIINWGPDLIPQPGAVWRQKDYLAIGGIDTRFSMAFDFDLFIKLHKFGGGLYNSRIKSYFRWHSNSSSVSNRWKSVREASDVRRNNRKRLKNLMYAPAELIVMFATWSAGKILSLRLE